MSNPAILDAAVRKVRHNPDVAHLFRAVKFSIELCPNPNYFCYTQHLYCTLIKGPHTCPLCMDAARAITAAYRDQIVYDLLCCWISEIEPAIAYDQDHRIIGLTPANNPVGVKPFVLGMACDG